MDLFKSEGWYNIGIRNNEKIIDILTKDDYGISRDISANSTGYLNDSKYLGARIFFANVGTLSPNLAPPNQTAVQDNSGLYVDISSTNTTAISKIDTSSTLLEFAKYMLNYPTGYFDSSLSTNYTLSGEFEIPTSAGTFKPSDWVEILNINGLWDLSLNFSTTSPKVSIGAWIFLDQEQQKSNNVITVKIENDRLYLKLNKYLITNILDDLKIKSSIQNGAPVYIKSIIIFAFNQYNEKINIIDNIDSYSKNTPFNEYNLDYELLYNSGVLYIYKIIGKDPSNNSLLNITPNGWKEIITLPNNNIVNKKLVILITIKDQNDDILGKFDILTNDKNIKDKSYIFSKVTLTENIIIE